MLLALCLLAGGAPAWAAAPLELVFVRGSGEAATVHGWTAASGAAPLGASGPGWLAGPVSPDGGSVLVIAVGAEGQQLLRVRRSDGAAEALGPPAQRLRQPRWMASGQAVVVERVDAGSPQIWHQPADGAPGHVLTAQPTGAFDGAPSPDGTGLAFVAHRDGGLDLWLQPLGGGPAAPLLSAPGDQLQPTWSPDGHRIAFLSDEPGRLAVHTIAADGTGQRTTWRPAPDEAARIVPEQGLAWSPAGDALALVTRRDDGRPEVRLVDARRGRVLARTGANAAAEHPAWLPDGSGVVVAGPDGLSVLSRDGQRTPLGTGPAWLPRVAPAR